MEVKRVKTIRDVEDLPKGSSIKVTEETDDGYHGIWASMGGTFIVFIEKEHCEIIEMSE